MAMQAGQVSSNEMDQYDWEYLEIEKMQYDYKMWALTGQHLEGMNYKLSKEEDKFKVCATFCLVMIFFTYSVHQTMKFFRFKQTNWHPDMNSKSIAPWVKLSLDLIEQQFAPSLIVICMNVSVGATHGFAVVLTLIIFLMFIFMFVTQKNNSLEYSTLQRFVVYVCTLMLLINILANDHIFEESTLPQKIGDSMTQQALQRHGVKESLQSWEEEMQGEMYKLWEAEFQKESNGAI